LEPELELLVGERRERLLVHRARERAPALRRARLRRLGLGRLRGRIAAERGRVEAERLERRLRSPLLPLELLRRPCEEELRRRRVGEGPRLALPERAEEAV